MPKRSRLWCLTVLLPWAAGCSSEPNSENSNDALVGVSGANGGPAVQGSASGGAPATVPSGTGGTAPPNQTTGGVANPDPVATGGSGVGGGADSAGGTGGTASTVAAGAGGGGGSTVPDPGTEGDGDFTIMPPYQRAPELTVANSVPQGELNLFTLSSSSSAFYPADVATGNVFTRNVWVYVPAQYVTGIAAPFMVVQDGGSNIDRIPPVLDSLINDGRLPVMIAVLINPGPGDGITSERGLEYDTVSETYLQFIETEILPTVESMYNVTLTTDPEGRAAVGSSSGGTAAFTMGWFRPDLYRRILTYSGSFVALGADVAYPRGAWEYHEHLIGESDLKPLRIFLEAGENDNTIANVTHDLDPALSAYYGWLEANENMAGALAAKGYHYRYVYAAGAGHADGNVIGQTLSEDLLWLWRGYPIQ